MKILLISPPSVNFLFSLFIKEPIPPIGLCYLCAALEKDGHDVIVRDYTGWTKRRIEKDILNINPSIVGISCFTLLRFKSFKMAKFVKKISPKTKILMGGPHATFFPKHIFELSPTDVVIYGEGEITIVNLANAFSKGKNIKEIKGIVYKNKEGSLVVNPPQEMIDDLDQIPSPNYDDFNLKNQKSIPIISSRGCPFACTFCSTNRFWGRRYRFCSAKYVVDEIEFLMEKTKKKDVLFWDDNFILNKKRAMQICDEILKRKLKIRFVAEARIDGIDEEVLQKLKEAGCKTLMFGLESGSPTILKNINKGYSINQAKEKLKMAQKYVNVHPLLMFGNKGESKQTVDETIKFCKEIFPKLKPLPYSPVYLFPNTPLYDEVKSKGLINDSYWKSEGIAIYTVEHSPFRLFLLRERCFVAFRSRFSLAYLKFILYNFVRNFLKFQLG